jgi:hypothetical protein
MVDTGTFNRLSADEQNEYHRYSSKFIRAVLKTDANDVYDFEQKYLPQNKGGTWFLSKSVNGDPLAGIKVSSKKVIESLLTDAYLWCVIDTKTNPKSSLSYYS